MGFVRFNLIIQSIFGDILHNMKMIKRQQNSANNWVQLTANPLRSLAAGELGRYPHLARALYQEHPYGRRSWIR